MLTQERVRELFDYNPDTGDLVWKVNRRGRFARIGAVAGYKGRYVTISIDCDRYPAHQIVYLWHHGYVPDEIDHENRVKTDNRIGNLRECSRPQNTGNVGLRSTNTSGYRGVCFANYCNKWRAMIKINGTSKHLGYFNDPVSASRAYDCAALQYFREFAYLNHADS
jgi:hypothetical protein